MAMTKDRLKPNSPETPGVSVGLLGELTLQPAGAAIPPKTQALLAYLAMTGQAWRRHDLQNFFFQHAGDPQRALRWHLHRLRRAFTPSLLLSATDPVGLDFERVTVDSAAFERGLNDHTPASLSRALDLYRGEFLAGLKVDEAPEFELWVLGERTRLQQLYERGLLELTNLLSAAGDYDAAIQRAQQLAQSNPLLEEAHARLMWLYSRTGQREAALQQYRLCRDWLQRELAVDPTPELTALHQRILAGDLGHPALARALANPATPLLRPALDFVGREAELSQLQAAWQAAQVGQGNIVFVEAEAGGGKTRLLREFMQTLPAELCLEGRCFESTRHLPYHPWIEVLDRQLARLGREALQGWSPFWQRQLAGLLPSLAEHLGQSPEGRPPTSGSEVELLFTAAAELLLRPPGHGPASRLIFVDDIQWADEDSLQLFHFVARRLVGTPVLLVGAYRPEEAEGSPLPRLLDDAHRNPLTRLRLPTLTPAEVEALMPQHWPALPGSDRPTVATMLSQATNGNPLFIVEIMRELAHTPQAPGNMPVPASLHNLVQRRLRQMPDSARQVLEALAVMGEPTTVHHSQQTSARSEAETVAGLDLGLRRGLLRTQANDPNACYDFAHDLLREATLSQLSDVRRRLLHRRAAKALAQSAGRLAPRLRAELASRILRHALAGQDHAQVLRWASVAAEHAQHLCAYSEALSAYEAASSAFNYLHETGHAAAEDRHQGLEFLLNRLDLLHRLGRRADMGALLPGAAELLTPQVGPRLQARYHLLRAKYLAALNDYAAAVAAAREAHAHSQQAHDTALAAQCLYQAGEATNSQGQTRLAWQLLEESLALYRAAGEPRGESICLTELAWSALDYGEALQARAYLEQALQLAEASGDLYGRAQACAVISLTWHMSYRSDKIRAYAEDAHRMFTELGNAVGAGRTQLFIATSLLVKGEWAAAEALFHKTITQAQALQDGWAEGWAAQLLGRLLLWGRDLTAAERWLQHSHRLRREHGEVHNQISDLSWLGRLHLVLGQPAQALAYTTDAVTQLDTLSGQTSVWELPDVLFCHAEALAAGQRPEEARQYLQRAHERLMHFYQHQIDDDETRQVFLNYFLNARLLAAWQSGQFQPFPQ